MRANPTILRHRLLILSCSALKLCETYDIQAIDRYDGPLYRIVRKFLRDEPVAAASLTIYILSAEFGLIPAERPIPFYDRRMTAERAVEIRPQVVADMQQVLNRANFNAACLCASASYLLALGRYQDYMPQALPVTLVTGARWQMQSGLHAWLYGAKSGSQPFGVGEGARRISRIRGVELKLTQAEVLDVAQNALQTGRLSANDACVWHVKAGEARIGVKDLVAHLSGLPKSAFNTTEARRVLLQLGIETVRDSSSGIIQ